MYDTCYNLAVQGICQRGDVRCQLVTSEAEFPRSEFIRLSQPDYLISATNAILRQRRSKYKFWRALLLWVPDKKIPSDERPLQGDEQYS